MKTLRAFIPEGQRQIVMDAEPGTPITFIASTEGEKRDGKDLSVDNWSLENYRKNPVFLWSHDYWGSRLPIGRAEAYVDQAARLLKTDVVFDQDDEFARQVENKYRKGFLHTVSVGWDEVEIDGKLRYDLLDISGVTVPGDPDAVMERQYRALKEIFETDEGAGSEPTPEELSDEKHWERAAAEMAGLFSPECELEDSERTSEYHRICKEYRKLEKTPPELLSMGAVTALGAEELRGLFLEGEDQYLEIVEPEIELSPEQKRKLKALFEQAVEILGEDDNPAPESDPEPEDDGLPAEAQAELEKTISELDKILEDNNA